MLFTWQAEKPNQQNEISHCRLPADETVNKRRGRVLAFVDPWAPPLVVAAMRQGAVLNSAAQGRIRPVGQCKIRLDLGSIPAIDLVQIQTVILDRVCLLTHRCTKFYETLIIEINFDWIGQYTTRLSNVWSKIISDALIRDIGPCISATQGTSSF
jgi:hypothetical protein